MLIDVVPEGWLLLGDPLPEQLAASGRAVSAAIARKAARLREPRGELCMALACANITGLLHANW